MGSIVKKIHEISADFLPKYSLSVTDFASLKPSGKCFGSKPTLAW